MYAFTTYNRLGEILEVDSVLVVPARQLLTQMRII
jgi:hypothetical protein